MADKLSKKPIPARERLIFALDTPDIGDAKRLVELLGDTVHFYKLGLELFMAGGYFELIGWLAERNKKSFVDLKFFDVPQTVASAVRQLRGKHATFATVHGNDEILKAAVQEKNGIKILAVTVLTSLDDGDLKSLGFKVNTKELVDQKRTVDVEDAFRKGADYIVVGRPIRDTPDPKKAAQGIQDRIAKLFAK